ncbi:MAG: ABC transporter ATP-binding protein [Alphaproteobacteria bacterium]|nr:ABC transporter ATP-binding protein [Alphaproteobacteria bacterium]MBV9914699.1 ABC transporter ATP-binding protein [Nevskiaceae bacterium]
MSEAALRLERVARRYPQGQGTLEVFRDLSLTINPGELVALVGPSGAGKSSLLHIAGLLEAPSGGEVYIDGAIASQLSDRERTRLRRERIGFVYQAHHLLPEFSALENVIIPQRIAGVSRARAHTDAVRMLTQVGLGERLEHRPAQLSGGEQQRVAIARALANRPRLLLADEPTGNLDPRTAQGVFEMLLQLVRSGSVAALIATHNQELAARMDRALVLHDGHLVEQGLTTSRAI